MGKSVLIVDDISYIRDSIRDILEDGGFEVIGEAADGREGVTMFCDLKPDIVLMDVVMPVMDGFQALESIRDYDREAAVIMMSGLTMANLDQKCLNLGARGFIPKPFEIPHLLDTLSRV